MGITTLRMTSNPVAATTWPYETGLMTQRERLVMRTLYTTEFSSAIMGIKNARVGRLSDVTSV